MDAASRGSAEHGLVSEKLVVGYERGEGVGYVWIWSVKEGIMFTDGVSYLMMDSSFRL